MHFLFTLADVGVNLSLAPQVECDCAVDLFQGERREILLNRLRTLAASEGVDDRVQRHPRARHVIAAIPLFDVVAAHPSSDYTAKRAILHSGADGTVRASTSVLPALLERHSLRNPRRVALRSVPCLQRQMANVRGSDHCFVTVTNQNPGLRYRS